MVKKEKEGGNKNIFYEKIIIFLLVIMIFLMVIMIFSFISDVFNTEKNLHSKCGDGTLEFECSLNKPYFCEKGILYPKASICGCPENMEQVGDKCTSDLYKKPEERYFEYVLNGEKGIINITVYKGILNHFTNKSRIITYKGERPSLKDFILKDINDSVQKQALMPLVVEIQNIAKDKDTQAKIAISFIQRIPYGNLQEQVLFNRKGIQDYRYPYEVVYDNKGVCGEKSELLILLLKELGFGTASFYYKYENHVAVGIRCPIEKSFNKSGYCFVETTGPSIISAHQNNYIGSTILTTSPEIIPITEGISLSDNLDDYEDSEKWIYLNKLLEKDGYLNYFRTIERDKLIKKYGL